MTNIQDKLEEEIYVFMSSSPIMKEPSVILMHPNTWAKLIEEVFLDNESMAINRYEKELKYRGIEVIRVLKIEEGEFRIF